MTMQIRDRKPYQNLWLMAGSSLLNATLINYHKRKGFVELAAFQHTLHQLLREVHHKNSHHPFSHPSSGPLGSSKNRMLACPLAADGPNVLDMIKTQMILEQIIAQAQHIFMRKRTQYVLDTLARDVVTHLQLPYSATSIYSYCCMMKVERVFSFRYGKDKCKGDEHSLANKLEVPKSSLKDVIMHSTASELVVILLDFIGNGKNEHKVLIKSNEALIATLLMASQCLRRFYETNFVQIFSRKNKMNLFKYIGGYLHGHAVPELFEIVA
uniref:Uncharacterized protein n=1 Tax=Glossina pallidipes TaxID=7398 RepID=A0A1B0AFN8_GLOPL